LAAVRGQLELGVPVVYDYVGADAADSLAALLGENYAPAPPPMSLSPGPQRQLHSATEIRNEIARLLNAARPFPLRVPLPLSADRGVDGSNANWDLPAEFRAKAGYQIDIGLAVLAVKRRWDLRDGEPGDLSRRA
jgi:hypothetical protein